LSGNPERAENISARDPQASSAVAAELQEAIGYRFRDRQLLLKALTHPSCAAPATGESNQRLEFLGDAALGFVIAGELYRRFPQITEGRLTELRSTLVSETALAQQARRVQLGRSILMDKGQALQGGADNPSILADAYEGLIGAIYLDGGLRSVQRVIRRQFLKGWRPEDHLVASRNEKSLLLERAQARGLHPRYRLIFQSGPEHRKVFAVRVLLGRRVVGEGWGFRKKDAERMAAREALKTVDLQGKGDSSNGLFSHRRAEDDPGTGPGDR
jgi:ribonuclease-3